MIWFVGMDFSLQAKNHMSVSNAVMNKDLPAEDLDMLKGNREIILCHY